MKMPFTHHMEIISFFQHYFQSGPNVNQQTGAGASQLTIQWTIQHGCGGNEDTDPQKQNCNLVLQYMCEDTIENVPGMEQMFRKYEHAFCKCQNKGTAQLCGNRAADQPLGFRYIDSIQSQIPKSKIISLLAVFPACVGPGWKP